MEGKDKSRRFGAQILVGTLKTRLTCSPDENFIIFSYYQISDI